jgi:hypothetical protein
MVPGQRTAVGELQAANRVSPGGKSELGRDGDRQPLFAGAVEWEDIHDEEDPAAQDEAQQPGEDEEADGPADEEGELDTDGEEEEAVAEPLAPESPAGEPGHAPAAAASQAPTGSGTQPETSGSREGAPRASRAPARARAASAGKTYHVNRSYRDGPYGGTAKYDVRVTAKAITATVGIRLKAGRGVSSSQVKQVKSASQAIFKQKYDSRFKLTEIPYKPRPLRMKVSFAHPKPHHDVALHKGGGRDNAANWYVKGDTTTRAHEIGHLLGLKDEYADDTSPDRKVHTDNSLMGNYYAEGIKTASLKKRHGKVFAGDISRASGRKFYLSS